MVTIADLWLPILLSGVAVFVVSFMMWMVFPHHKGDWQPLPDEDATMDALRDLGVSGPGQFTMPHVSSNEQMRDPEFIAKWNRGPSGFLILRPPGAQSMAKNMAISLVYNLVTLVIVAYVATIGLTAASEATDVLRLVSTTAFLAFGAALGWGAIWFARSWRSTLLEMFDGLVYGVVTGIIFVQLWPFAA